MKFSSSHLQSCFDAAKPILDNIDKTKNMISEDIRELEAYLKSISINESIDYIATNPSSLNAFRPNGVNHNGIAFEEILRWDHKVKRLIYLRNEYQASLDNFDNPPVEIDWSSVKKSVEKPLIEAPFEIRKYMYINEHLGKFITEVSNNFCLSDNKKDQASVDDDIPF